jgi:hypothetical protein
MSTNFPFFDLTPEAVEALKEVEKKQKNGEDIDQKTVEALKAIDMASIIVDSIMSGRQIDLAYFRVASANLIKKIQGEEVKEPEKKRVIKKKKYQRS